MKIIYGKQLTTEEFAICQQIALECGILIDTAKLLFYRDINTVEKAKTFLNPSKNGFNNPFLLNGMAEAVQRINLARENNQKVLIFGDYDADGICATAILYYCLRDFGIKAITVIPERDEGYGLNIEKITKINEQEKIDLIITVDCGISDEEKIALINKMGIDVIVTDHHEPPQERLKCIAINPKLNKQEYPFKGLCGAGVAYKLGVALIGEKADEYLDFTALATVADSMELIGENRDIVVEGLKLFNRKDVRPQFKAILAENNGRLITAQGLAYTVAPKINAGGRMGDANLALSLLLTDKESEIFDYTAKLTEYNFARQVECDKIYKEAKAIISENSLENDQIILVKNKGWQAGFIGIVAAKLTEDYSRPVIVFAEQDGKFKGSARSIEQINIFDAIASASDLLVAFGGHSQAAGISVSEENFEKLRETLNLYVKNNCEKIDFEKKFYAEWDIKDEFSLRFANEIDMLEPFGVGNRKPLFTTEVEAVTSKPLKTGSPHYTYKTDAIEILDFNGEHNVFALSLPINKKVIFETNLSTYKNKQSLKGYSKHVVVDYDDFTRLKPLIFTNQIKTLVSYNNAKPTIIRKNQIEEFKTIGTVFAVSDVDNLKFYPELSSLNISLFNLDQKNSACSIVVQPQALTEGVKRVVYLDKPLSYISGAELFIIPDLLGYKILDKISTDRNVFTQYFIKLKGLVGKEFIDITDFCRQYCGNDDLYQFIFATVVFMELKIFSVKNDKFIFNSNVKNPLTNSKAYSTISLINA